MNRCEELNDLLQTHATYRELYEMRNGTRRNIQLESPGKSNRLQPTPAKLRLSKRQNCLYFPASCTHEAKSYLKALVVYQRAFEKI